MDLDAPGGMGGGLTSSYALTAYNLAGVRQRRIEGVNTLMDAEGTTGLNPWGVAIGPDGSIYATTTASTFPWGGVLVFAPSANGNAAPTAVITGFGNLRLPVGIAVDSTGNIYVSDNRRDFPYNGTNADPIFVFAAGAVDDSAPIAIINGSNTHLSVPSDPWSLEIG